MLVQIAELRMVGDATLLSILIVFVFNTVVIHFNCGDSNSAVNLLKLSSYSNSNADGRKMFCSSTKCLCVICKGEPPAYIQ